MHKTASIKIRPTPDEVARIGEIKLAMSARKRKWFELAPSGISDVIRALISEFVLPAEPARKEKKRKK